MNIIYIGNRLSKHGFSISANEILGPMLEENGYNVLYSGKEKSKIIRFLKMITTVIRNRSWVDLVLVDTYSTQAFYYAYVIGKICQWLRVKYICVLHGGDLPARLSKSPVLCESLFGKSIANVAVSKYLQNEFKASGFDTKLIHNPIYIKDFEFLKRSKFRPKILWVRSFHSIYNPKMAVEVLNILSSKFEDVSLCMVGATKDGSFDETRRFVLDLNIESRILMPGVLTRKGWSKIAKDYDIFINTSNYDNFPFSLIEAMALGMPVVSTNVGGVPYMIDDGRNGLLCKKGDPVDMANKIGKIINDNSLGIKIADKGRRFVENLDQSIIIKEWNRLLHNCYNESN